MESILDALLLRFLLNDEISNKSDSSHNHDDRYFVNTTFADMMIVYTQDLSGDSALGAGEAISLSDTATTYDGYMPLCIVGIRNLSTPRAPQLVDFYKGGSNSINVRVLNDSDSSVNVSIRFYILYIKSYFV